MYINAIKGISDKVLERLKKGALSIHRSLNKEIIYILELQSKIRTLNQEEILAKVRKGRSYCKGGSD